MGKTRELPDDLQDLLDSAPLENYKYRKHFEELVCKLYVALRQPLRVPEYKPLPPFTRETPEILALVSDIHVGKLTESYNLKVLSRRLLDYERYLISEIVRTQTPILHLALIGDIVDGDDIFPGHAFAVEVPTIQQYFIAADLFARMISRLSGYCKIKVPCVPGNHGRQGRKGEKPVLSNWDYLVYKLLERELSQNDRVTFCYPEGHKFYIRYPVAGSRFLLMHGHAIEGAGSKNTLVSAALKWRNSIPNWDYIAFGHWHSDDMISVGDTKIFCNGTSTSGDSFSEEVVKTVNSPSQKVLVLYPGTDKRRQIISVTNYPL